MGRKVVADSEGDGLDPNVIWCIVCKDLDTDEIFKFKEEEVNKEFLEFSKEVDLWIGHSFIDYDVPAFKKILGIEIPVNKIVDTLILSRMAKPNRVGGHGIKNWGRILGREKPDHEDWSKYSPEMLHRCTEDVEITALVYKRLVAALKNFNPASIRMEHKLQQIITQQEKTGFKLDVKKAMTLLAELTDIKTKLETQILQDFGLKAKFLKEVEPKITKKGEISKVGLSGIQEAEGPFSLVEFEKFNLDSPKQIVSRLNAVGWNPIHRTDGFENLKKKFKEGLITKEIFEEKAALSWKVDEDNLATISPDAPQSAKNLAVWKMTSSRSTLVETWLNLIDKKDRIHGRVNTIGTWTHRMSHYDPNMANIPGVEHDGKTGEISFGLEGKFGFECRDCWTVDKSRILVGVDAKGIQLRAFASYVGDDDYVRTVVEGDPHLYHANLLSNLVGDEISRPKSKTFIYAYLLGAGVAKISSILGSNCGSKVKKEFPKALPGLEEFFSELDNIAAQGYMKAIDGRLIKIPSRHLALAAALQSFEKIIMGRAICISDHNFRKEEVDTNLVAVVHDETQWDTLQGLEKKVSDTMIQSIRTSGEIYETKCPMDGDAKWGKTWAETH